MIEKSPRNQTRCPRCGVKFEGAPPTGSDSAWRNGEIPEIEWLRCPDCGRRFWTAVFSGQGGRCVVGLHPVDMK